MPATGTGEHLFAIHPRVVIFYTHDNERHRQDVLDFATLLKTSGIEVHLDRWADLARQDWYVWAVQCLDVVDYVLVIASEGYRRMGDGTGPGDRNRGGQSEAALLRDRLQGNRAIWTAKILPVVLPGQDIGGIPYFLQPQAATWYVVEALTPAGIENVLRVITGQPRHVPPRRGRIPRLPPLTGPGSEPTAAS